MITHWFLLSSGYMLQKEKIYQRTPKGILMTSQAHARIDHYIDGKVVQSSRGRQQDVFNPATGAVTAQVAFASVAEDDAAVASASAAAMSWAATAPLKRARELSKFKELIEKHHDALA